MAMRRQLAVGSIWTAGVRAGVSLMGLASTIILARLLAPEDFGLVAVAAVTFAIVGAFTGLYLAAALIQHPNPTRAHYDSAWTLGVIRGLGVGGVLVVIGIFFALFGEHKLSFIMYAFGLTAFIEGLKNPKLIDFQRRLSFHQELLIQLVQKFAGLVVGVSIALIYQNFWAIVAGSMASQGVSVVLSYALIPYRPRFCLQEWRGLMSFSGWAALGAGVREVNWRADQFLVGGVLGASTLGQYNVGGRLASLPVNESMAPLTQVLFPAFAKLQHESKQLRSAYLRAQRMLAFVAIPVGVGFSLVAPPLVEFAMGAKWALAGQVIQVLSILFALQALAIPFGPVAFGLGRTRLVFIRDVINLLVRYPILVIGFFTGGLVGLLAARGVATVFVLGQDMYLGRRLTGATFAAQIFSSWRVYLAAILMVAVVLSLQFIGINSPTVQDLMILIGAGAASYIGATIALWLVSGKPAGPEREVIEMTLMFTSALKRSRA